MKEGDEEKYDETGSYVQDYGAPFIGEVLLALMMSKAEEVLDIARRVDGKPLEKPLPVPKERE